MEQKYQILQKQKQIFSQKQLQSLNILAMDNIELDAFLQSEYLENPMLDQTGIPSSNKKESRDQEYDWSQKIDNGESIQEFLKIQLYLYSRDKLKNTVMEYLIECIDDSGYFTMSIEEVSKCLNVDLKYISNCLEELKCFDPVGVFSQSLSECLIRQLNALEIKNEVLFEIIYNHLDDIALGNIGHISRTLDISTAQVRKYILMIEALNPRPVVGFSNNKTEYVVPDIILKKSEIWEIELNESWTGNYQVSSYYQKLMHETSDPDLKEYFSKKLQRAQFIMQNIESRRDTLFKITRAVFDHQKNFFEGAGLLKPMTMSEIADEIGMNTSTISRAVKGKYIQYPKETILMKSLFSASVSNGSDYEDVNAQEIKSCLKKWISEENKKKPYSDQKLLQMLSEEGIKVSRRTIAKYRNAMGIKSSFDRKELA